MSVDIDKIKIGDVLISKCNFEGIRFGDKVKVTSITKAGEVYYRGSIHNTGAKIGVEKINKSDLEFGFAEVTPLSLRYEWTENTPTLCTKCEKGNCFISPRWECKHFITKEVK